MHQERPSRETEGNGVHPSVLNGLGGMLREARIYDVLDEWRFVTSDTKLGTKPAVKSYLDTCRRIIASRLQQSANKLRCSEVAGSE